MGKVEYTSFSKMSRFSWFSRMQAKAVCKIGRGTDWILGKILVKHDHWKLGRGKDSLVTQLAPESGWIICNIISIFTASIKDGLTNCISSPAKYSRLVAVDGNNILVKAEIHCACCLGRSWKGLRRQNEVTSWGWGGGGEMRQLWRRAWYGQFCVLSFLSALTQDETLIFIVKCTEDLL